MSVLRNRVRSILEDIHIKSFSLSEKTSVIESLVEQEIKREISELNAKHEEEIASLKRDIKILEDVRDALGDEIKEHADIQKGYEKAVRDITEVYLNLKMSVEEKNRE